MNEKKFYVYEHWRTDRQECFYVGKGHGRRAYDMRRGRNRWHKFLQAKLSSLGTAIEIKIIADGLTEEEAFAKEIERIAFWKSDGADLCNLTLGGDGPSGYVCPEERKRAVSEKLKGRKMSAESRAKMSLAAMGNKKGLGKKKPQRAIDAMRAHFTGKPKSEETKRKISETKKGKPWNGAHSPELLARRSAEMTGVPFSEERKSKMRGIPKSEAHKQKLREHNLGKMHNEETRKKIAENTRLMWAKRRAEKSAELASANLTLEFGEK